VPVRGPEKEIDMDEQVVIQSSAPFIGILSQLIAIENPRLMNSLNIDSAIRKNVQPVGETGAV